MTAPLNTRWNKWKVDLIFGTEGEAKGSVDYGTYVTKWKRQMQEAYAIASRHSNKSGEPGKKNQDRKVHSNALEPGKLISYNVLVGMKSVDTLVLRNTTSVCGTSWK